jgi:hypothetical protein
MIATFAAVLLLAPPLQEPVFPRQPLKVSKVVDVAGKTQKIPATGAKATVVVFVTVDCPIANRMAPEVVRICEAYKSRQVSFLLAYVDTSVSRKNVQKHLREYGFPCPGFIDTKHKIVNAVGATVTPQAAVLDSKGMLVYRGRINDLFEEHGKAKAKATKNELRDALNETLAGKPVTTPLMPATGCYIPPL